MKRHALLPALLLAATLLAGTASADEAVPVQYRPKAGHFWDHWLLRAPDDAYHLFYLYEPPGAPEEFHRQQWSVGHAVSRDLVAWRELPVALQPSSDNWLDRKIATGSAIKFGNGFAMLVTGYGSREMGFAAAASDDLSNWRWMTDHPVLPPAGPWYETADQWKDNPPECAGWADPYVFRKPGESAVYAVFNARVREGDVYGRGCLALARSENFVDWTLLPPLHVPGYCTRCETPQIFERDGRWYLIASMWPKLLTKSFKAEHPEAEQPMAGMVWTAERFEGPYELKGDWSLFPGLGCYICKVIEAPDRGDVVLTIRMEHIDGKACAGLSPAYRVSYPAEGGIKVYLDQPLGRAGE